MEVAVADTESLASTQEKSDSPEADANVKAESPDAQVKTIFNILSKLKETEPTSSKEVVSTTTLQINEGNEDIIILRRDPNTNRNTINKTAYLKLHRSLSPNRNNTIEKIKEQYEKNDKESEDSNTVDSENKKVETLETIKSKYSPAGLGYNYTKPSTKPQPAPKPRRSKLTRSQIILPSKNDPIKNARHSLNIEKNKYKDVNSNDLQASKEDLTSDEEFISIVTRSDSEESVYKYEKELSAFTMDKKKRANSFRKIFSVFSNKDKKKRQEDKSKVQNKENGEKYSDNFQNESNNFNRQTPHRHTTSGESKSLKSSNVPRIQTSNNDVKIPNHNHEEQLEKDYAKMHINQFNRFKQNFEIPPNQDSGNRIAPDGYTPMDKPIYKSQADTTNYMNMPTVRKYIDTSSSASTLESDRSNLYQNEALSRSNQNNQSREDVELRYYPSNSFRPSRISDGRRDTPPRLLETQQDVRLVNPKALIPINSERPLPNPYQNGDEEFPVVTRRYPLSHGTPTNQGKKEEIISRKPYLEETYGTVLDSLEIRQRAMKAQNKNNMVQKEYEKPPRSPSLEPSKLKLPPNRDIVPLSPRVRSPIPTENISTEKMIATELLRPKRSPTPTKKGNKDSSPSHQRFEIDIDYPDNVKYASKNSLLRSTDNLIYKPPVAARPSMKKVQDNLMVPTDYNRFSQASSNSVDNVALRQRISPASPINSPDKVTTNVQVHMNSPVYRTPTPNNSMQNLSLSPIRPTNIDIRPLTPSDSRIAESPKTTPQKEDIRKSVEAYYWKEIKKLKDQENQELYLLQMQYGNMFPYGYAEDPISVRRSRSNSPSAGRNSRRSLSLPRDARQPPNVISEKYYPGAIPENRAVMNQIQPRSVQQIQFQQQQYFTRNTPERRTIDGSNTRVNNSNTNSLYRPIFKRGSLNTPPSQANDDSLKRKVSFSGAQDLSVQSWPTRNGFTQSPPQRRIEKLQSPGDDEVFLPNTPKIVNNNQYQYAESNRRPDLPNEEMYYNTRQAIIGPNGEPLYIPRSNQDTLYMQQRQAAENPYGQRINPNQRYLPNQSEEVLYGQPIDTVRPGAVRGLTRHGSIQINEEIYDQRPVLRRISYQSNSLARPSVSSTPVPNQEVQYVTRQSLGQSGVQPLRREIILNDEIFGQFGGYMGPNKSVRVVPNQNVYASRQGIAEYNSRVRDQYYIQPTQQQVSVSNKVCDIYGQIHDSDQPKVQQSGMIMGQLHRSPGSPAVIRTSHQQLPARDNFVRNSRLTASANDMYRRVQNTNPQYPKDTYGRIEPPQVQNGNVAPNRPLPPVPQGKKGAIKGAGRSNLVSDTESGSDASEVQRILNSSTKTKKRGIFGK